MGPFIWNWRALSWIIAPLDPVLLKFSLSLNWLIDQWLFNAIYELICHLQLINQSLSSLLGLRFLSLSPCSFAVNCWSSELAPLLWQLHLFLISNISLAFVLIFLPMFLVWVKGVYECNTSMFMNVSERKGKHLKKSCAVSEIAGCLRNIKRTFTSLANADIKAVWLFEDMSLLRTDVMHQHFVRATTTALLLMSKCKIIFGKKLETYLHFQWDIY